MRRSMLSSSRDTDKLMVTRTREAMFYSDFSGTETCRGKKMEIVAEAVDDRRRIATQGRYNIDRTN